MTPFSVIREAGPAWADGGIAQQPALADHGAFMNALAERGFVLFAGPLGGSEAGRLRALLIVDAQSEDDVHERLEDDPWTRSGQLQMVSVEPWNVFVGAERLASVSAAASR
jgi:uncharacterized protein